MTASAGSLLLIDLHSSGKRDIVTSSTWKRPRNLFYSMVQLQGNYPGTPTSRLFSATGRVATTPLLTRGVARTSCQTRLWGSRFVPTSSRVPTPLRAPAKTPTGPRQVSYGDRTTLPSTFGRLRGVRKRRYPLRRCGGLHPYTRASPSHRPAERSRWLKLALLTRLRSSETNPIKAHTAGMHGFRMKRVATFWKSRAKLQALTWCSEHGSPHPVQRLLVDLRWKAPRSCCPAPTFWMQNS
jgi:hypothetical protein